MTILIDEERVYDYFGSQALSGVLSGPESASLGGSKVVALSLDYAEKMMSYRELISPSRSQLFDLYGGRALNGILSSPHSSSYHSSQIVAKARDYAEKMMDARDDEGFPPECELFDHYAAQALNGILSSPAGLSFGSSKVIAMSANHARLVLEKKG